MRTGIYVRVSTDEQAREGYSIRAQIEKLTDYAKVKDWLIYDIYNDEGKSGKDVEGRPDIQRLLNDIEEKRVNNVLVYKIDRLTRSTKNLIELVDFFNEHECGFNSLVESIDTNSATGRMFIKIIGIFAEFERENMIERVKVGNARKAKEGFTMACGIISYGYSREKGEKVQKVDVEEADIVQEIFRMYVQENKSLTKISHLLNARGVPTKRNSLWTCKTVRLIIQNPNYIGRIRYQVMDKDAYVEYDGLHEPIIDEATFYLAQEKINGMKQVSRTKHVKSDAYFTGIAVCERCGTKLSPKRSYKHKNGEIISYPGYRCMMYPKGLCDMPTISHLKLERAFIEYLDRFEELNEVTEANLQDVNRETVKAETQQEIKSLKRDLEKLNNKLVEIMELYVKQSLDFQEYQAMTKMLKDKIVEVDNRLSELTSHNHEPECPEFNFAEISRNVKENWKHLNNEEKMQFLHKFVNNIVVSSEGKEHFKEVKIKQLAFKNK